VCKTCGIGYVVKVEKCDSILKKPTGNKGTVMEARNYSALEERDGGARKNYLFCLKNGELIKEEETGEGCKCRGGYH
jgi:hypothetical protein